MWGTEGDPISTLAAAEAACDEMCVLRRSASDPSCVRDHLIRSEQVKVDLFRDRFIRHMHGDYNICDN